MTGPEREAFDALREALKCICDGKEWDCGDDCHNSCMFCQGRSALALAEKADTQEPVVRLTLEKAHAIRNGWNAAVRSEQCTLCRGTLVNCRRCMADGRLAAAGEEILAAAIKAAEGGNTDGGN